MTRLATGAAALMLDLRWAWRGVSRRVRFSVLTTITLALGVGASASILSISNGVVFRSLPYFKSEQLVMIWRAPRDRPSVVRGFRDEFSLARQVATGAMVRAWREHGQLLEDLAALRLWQDNPSVFLDMVAVDSPVRLRAAMVTPNFFSLLGVRPYTGRNFAPSDTSEVAIVSHDLWRRRFGADPGIVGRKVDVVFGAERTRRTLTVIGVLPERVRFTYPEATEIWVVLPWHDVEHGNPHSLQYRAVGRLRSGVDIAAAQNQLDTVNGRVETDELGVPENRRMRIALEPVQEHVVGRARPALQLITLMAVLLVSVCASTVSLLVAARVAGSRQEIETRLALGSGVARLIRQFALENAMLAGFAAIVAVAIVKSFETTIRLVLPITFPRADEIQVDLPTVILATVIGAGTAGVAGLLPIAKLVTRARRPAAENEEVRAVSPRRLRKAVIAAQIGLVTTLLLVSLTLLRSLWQLQQIDVGFSAQGVVLAELRLLGPRYRDPATVQLFWDDLKARLIAHSIVRAATVASAPPSGGLDLVRTLRSSAGTGSIVVSERRVEPNYFDLLEIAVRRGQIFENNSRDQVVISEALASALFPNGDAVGNRISTGAEVVGVVSDVRSGQIDAAPVPSYYTSWSSAPWPAMAIMIEADAELETLRALIASTVTAIDSYQPTGRVLALPEVVGASLTERRFYTMAIASFTAIALLLTAIAIYGLTLNFAKERARELAIRAAIGARPTQQLALIVGDSLQPVAVGALFGAIAAFWVSRIIGRFLVGFQGILLIEYVAVASVLCVVAVLACAFGASRATHVSNISPVLRGD